MSPAFNGTSLPSTGLLRSSLKSMRIAVRFPPSSRSRLARLRAAYWENPPTAAIAFRVVQSCS
jgi:hypothetical protein